MNVNKISHTSWNCKYHVVFAPKYRRKAFYGSRRLEIGAILRKLCNWKGINIIEAEVCVDHVHMLIEIPPKYSVSGIMGYLKGKSSLLIYERWGNAKYKYRNRGEFHFSNAINSSIEPLMRNLEKRAMDFSRFSRDFVTTIERLLKAASQCLCRPLLRSIGGV